MFWGELSLGETEDNQMKVLKTQSTINIGRECGEAQVANTLALM